MADNCQIVPFLTLVLSPLVSIFFLAAALFCFLLRHFHSEETPWLPKTSPKSGSSLQTAELGEFGYSGVEVRVTPIRTEIIIRATRTQNVLGERGRRIRELTSLIQKRFNFPADNENVKLYAERVESRGLCAVAQCESLRFKLLGGLAVRRACYGKLRGQRAKAMKFTDGYMIHSGDPVNHFIDTAVRHIKLKQGVLGIKVKIMLPDPRGKGARAGASKVLQPDVITVHDPAGEKEEPAGGGHQGPQGYGKNVEQVQEPPQQQAPPAGAPAGYDQGAAETPM
eukprot:g44730.t1